MLSEEIRKNGYKRSEDSNLQTIGKVTLDYRFYPGQDFYCDGEVEEELLDIAKNYAKIEFQEVIEERQKWPILYHLSPIRENIVDWLPITKKDKVLEIGAGCGAITGKLASKAESVTCVDLSKQRSLINAYRNQDCDNVTIMVGNFQDIEPVLDCDYDYICLIGVFEYGQSYISSETPFEDFLKKFLKHKAYDGRIVIAIENRLGMKYFAGCREDHLGDFYSGIEDYADGGGVRTFSRPALEKIFRACKVKNYSFYYPYPDYKFMHTLYSDKRLPQVGELSDNIRNFDRDRMLLFQEKDAFDGAIRDGLFDVFSNSYLVVIGEDTNVTYAKYSNDRKMEYATVTKILMQDKELVVAKSPLYLEGNEHIESIERSYHKLCDRYENGTAKQKKSLTINRCSLMKEAQYSNIWLEYVNGVTLEQKLDECLLRDDMDAFMDLFDEYVARIKVGEGCGVTDFDLIFANIIIDEEDNWTLIDYEWTRDEDIKAEEIAFRAIYCYLLEDERRNKLDLDRIVHFLGIKEQTAARIREEEAYFQKDVTGRRKSMGEIREAFGGKIVEPTKWIEQMENRLGKDRIQVYEDRGLGYNEEHSYFVNDYEMVDNIITARIRVEGGISNLRIDPCMEACMVKLHDFTCNGESILAKKKAIVVNGKKLTNSMYVFATQDPNINVRMKYFPYSNEYEFYLRMEVVPVPESMANDIK